MKIKQTTLIYNTKYLQEINQMVLYVPLGGRQLPTQLKA